MDTQGVTEWRKATYSNGGGTGCVEVGRTSGQIAIRDTKNHGTGPVLTVPASIWTAFTATLKWRGSAGLRHDGAPRPLKRVAA